MTAVPAIVLLVAAVLMPVAAAASVTQPGETVVLLHGLLRSSGSMSELERALAAEGYRVVNIDYPSRSEAVEVLVDSMLAPRLAALAAESTAPLHFVTHSMGGILVRDYLKRRRPPSLGRVVMLAPPNAGSELVDRLGHLALFGWINGPAGRQLGTAADSLPNRLGPVDFALGVIAGDRSWNPLYSAMIPGPDDGKVSVERARVNGMTDFRVVHQGHTFLTSDPEVIGEVLHFLRAGRFAAGAVAEAP